jgi:hypothetical protein
MDEQQEKHVLQDHYEQELFHRPLSMSVTRLAPSAATQPSTTQPADPQLEAAISTMLGHIILSEPDQNGAAVASPIQPPTTQPVTGPS